jgi:hypothetical protein
MVGTASLPHILMRYFTTPSVRSARKSVGWSLFFIFLLYFTAPALATMTKLQLLDPTLPTAIIGKAFEEVAALPWVQNWGDVGMVALRDANGDGILQLNEFYMRDDIVVLATPEIAGLPYVISGLVAAGGMDVRLSIELRVQLCAEKQRERGVVQPEQQDDPAGERAVRFVVRVREARVEREQAREREPENAADERARGNPLPAPLVEVRAGVVHEREEQEDRGEGDWPAQDCPRELEGAAEVGPARDRLADRAAEDDQQEEPGGCEPTGED